MKTNVHFFIIFPQFFSECGIFQTKFIEKIKKIKFNNFFRKCCCLWDNVEKCGSAREAAESNIMWLMRIAFWLPKSTNKHSEYVIVSLFHCTNDCTNVPQCYIKRTVRVLLIFSTLRTMKDIVWKCIWLGVFNVPKLYLYVLLRAYLIVIIHAMLIGSEEL
jgi:hypothetical protein